VENEGEEEAGESGGQEDVKKQAIKIKMMAIIIIITAINMKRNKVLSSVFGN